LVRFCQTAKGALNLCATMLVHGSLSVMDARQVGFPSVRHRRAALRDAENRRPIQPQGGVRRISRPAGGIAMPRSDEEKKAELMAYLHEHVFDPILNSETASKSLKQGVRLTIMRMEDREAAGMLQYYWSAIHGTEKSIRFADMMRRE